MEMDLWFEFAYANAVLLYVAPLLVFLFSGSVVRYTPYTYVFTLVSASLWIRYAKDWGLHALLQLSQVGATLALVYIGLFAYLSERGDHRRTHLFWFGLGGMALLVGAVGFDFVTPKTTFYNVICCAAACLASAAPFYNLGVVGQEHADDALDGYVGELPENGAVNIGDHPANGAVNIGEHNVGHHAENGAGNVHDHNIGHHLENGGENVDGHDVHANANDAVGDHSDCSDISLDDRDDVQADGYEPDSEGSGHHGPLGDPEDVYLVHVASSSDEEVAAQPPAVQQETVAVRHHHVDIPDDVAV